MKQFFKFMFASMLGFLLVAIVLLFLVIGMISSIARFSEQQVVEVKPESVLNLNLNTEIVDRGGSPAFFAFNPLTMSADQPIGLNDLVNNIEKAKDDENIEGILLDPTGMRAGLATISEIRRALEDFKTSGKFVISYGEIFTQGGYYLASVADQVYMHPEGTIDFRGINAELMFFKNMLDKLGIEPQVIRHGQYKSAGEPFFLEEMSPANRRQTLSYISSIWNNVLNDISQHRDLSVNQLHYAADNFLSRNAQMALDAGMIDNAMFQDQLLAELKNRIGLQEDERVELIPIKKYANSPGDPKKRQITGRKKLAIVYGTGNIISGRGNDQSIGSDRIAEAIREARMDDSVEAIVFRINSPGGSALASDVILREVKLAAEVKPVIASMGDVAASGGYYVACGADMIIASPNTITGSIGVFGVIPNMKEFFNDKIGITFDNVKTNTYADLGTISRALTPSEKNLIQDQIDQVYETFITHVSQGREMPKEVVDSLGQGRVWSGAEALNIGLIDEFGGLDYAVEKAAEMANLEDYRVIELPRRKDIFTQLMEDFGGLQETMIRRNLGDSYIYYQQAKQVKEMKGIQARMPYDIILE